MIRTQVDELALWNAFVSRVAVTLPFRVDVLVRPCDPERVNADNRTMLVIRLHVLERDTREPITVDSRRPCTWTNEADAVELLFELIGVALTHELHESVRLDGKLARELHTWPGVKP